MKISRTGLLACIAALPLAATLASAATQRQHAPREQVTGIGGFFFRAKSLKALAQWYADNLGVGLTPTDYHQKSWRQEAGPTAFQPFPAGTKYFGRPDRQFMLNFRVRDLCAMVAQLRRAGIKVERDPTRYPNGVVATPSLGSPPCKSSSSARAMIRSQPRKMNAPRRESYEPLRQVFEYC